MNSNRKIPLVIINGPTAVGKTDASVELALKTGGEIISADSMQIYRGMDIGTAKIKPVEMKGVPHHLIDICDPDEEFSVLIFKELAQKAIEDIASRGKLPIICGGTGYYIQAVLYNVEFTEYDDEAQSEIRQKLERKLTDNGALYMHEYLRSFDPESAAIIHPNNTKRMLHAIEYFELTGRKISEHNREQHERTSPYDFRYFVITDDRESIYERIDRRVDKMLECGLVEEVGGIISKYGCDVPSMLGIGYKETADYLNGICGYEDMRYNIKRETRHFAKKQLTWFKREQNIDFIDRREYPSTDKIVDYMIQKIKESNYGTA